MVEVCARPARNYGTDDRVANTMSYFSTEIRYSYLMLLSILKNVCVYVCEKEKERGEIKREREGESDN